jgi:hypothetical protein
MTLLSNKKIGLSLLAAPLLAMSLNAQAGMVDPNSTLLDDAGAQMLEEWLGQGDLDWTSHWYGENGATTASWHGAVDNLTHTVSIFRAINALNQEVLVGGYTSQSWSGAGYAYDSAAFIFNLTQPEYQAPLHYPQYGVYKNANYFASFGGGHDLSGGYLHLGNTGHHTYDGYVSNHSYDKSKGTIDAGDNGDYTHNVNFRVLALETYTFSAAAPQPSFSDVPLALAGLLPFLGLGLMARRKRHQS